ncbi:MAG: CDP-alcohol phosphatidyltransferase family protein [Actinomycetota bacterium]|nr:CDP-alcohol phosphatidyltransferase family protein [Actinomycetota bacterium]
MINANLRERWDRLVRPVGTSLARAGVTPDAITYLGVLFHVVAAALIIEGRLLAAGLLSIVAGLSDAFDGAVAKARGTSSPFGAFLDSTTDRVSDALAFAPLAWLYGVAPDIAERDQPWVAALALATLVLSFLVSYTKARAESLGYDCNVGIAERGERLAIVVLALLFDLVPVALVILAVLSFVTFVQRMVHVRAQARA